jgi:hypothetical protein
VRSFQDSDGDGIGDLADVRSRLPYTRSLGVDGIWLNPFCASPQHDHGYDVSDHLAVHHEYGDLGNFEELPGRPPRTPSVSLPRAVRQPPGCRRSPVRSDSSAKMVSRAS